MSKKVEVTPLSEGEIKLKLLEGQKEIYFERMQRIYKQSLESTDPISQQDFLEDAETVEIIRDSFMKTLVEINSLTPGYTPNFQPWNALDLNSPLLK